MIRKLLHKYDRPGPRYTSYPTVPEWSGKFGPDEYINALQKASQSPGPLSLYIHIPFCRKRCFYCGCNTTITNRPDAADEYIELLDREIAMIGKHLKNRNRLLQMHWGGGTPTYLTNEQIIRLFKTVTDTFQFERNSEIAIEVDPRVTTFEQLKTLAQCGFNRISLGVQDFNNDVQKAIGRNQTYEQTRELFDQCRQLGFTGINIDLIYGLPRQTVANFAKTIKQVIDMEADRVAVYSYAHLPEIKTHQRKIDETVLPKAEEKYELFATAIETFLDAGYVQIGMDHFARPDDELARAAKQGNLYRNFMGYTTKRTDDMIGVGMSAIGDVAGCFAQNYSRISTYAKAVEKDETAIFRGCTLSDDDKIRRWVIMSIMCNGLLDFNELEKRFHVTYDTYFAIEDKELDEFIADGLIERNNERIVINNRGMLFVRNIAMVFDAYLRKKHNGKTPLYSRTI